jgi:hypothetical protein
MFGSHHPLATSVFMVCNASVMEKAGLYGLTVVSASYTSTICKTLAVIGMSFPAIHPDTQSRQAFHGGGE